MLRQSLKGFPYSREKLKLVKSQIRDYLLYRKVGLTLKRAAANLDGSVRHTDHIGFGPVAEERNVLLLLVPKQLLHLGKRRMRGQQSGKARLCIAEIAFVFPKGIIRIDEEKGLLSHCEELLKE